ncbi:MAG: glycosyltransferase [Planctomycetota bacterium]
MATIVCCRWLDAFPASYVTVLRNAVAKHLRREHRFVCVTDNVAGLESGVEGIDMPELGIPLEQKQKGCWPKLSIFKPGLLPPDEPTLYLDLDIVVRGSLDCYLDRIESQGGFNALREWNPTLWSLLPLAMRPHRGVQGSLLGFYPGQQTAIYETFMADQEAAFEKYELDQDFLSAVATGVTDWPFEWTASFKWHCCTYFPLNRIVRSIPEPRHSKVVVFHGKPRPIDVVPRGNYRWGTPRKFGYGPVDWVRSYWLEHDPTWADVLTSRRRGLSARMATSS